MHACLFNCMVFILGIYDCSFPKGNLPDVKTAAAARQLTRETPPIGTSESQSDEQESERAGEGGRERGGTLSGGNEERLLALALVLL